MKTHVITGRPHITAAGRKVLEQIRVAVQKAEARARKTYERKLAAENARHKARAEELLAELDAELKVARAALEMLPKDDPPANNGSAEGEEPQVQRWSASDDAEDDYPPDMVAVPAACGVVPIPDAAGVAVLQPDPEKLAEHAANMTDEERARFTAANTTMPSAGTYVELPKGAATPYTPRSERRVPRL